MLAKLPSPLSQLPHLSQEMTVTLHHVQDLGTKFLDRQISPSSLSQTISIPEYFGVYHAISSRTSEIQSIISSSGSQKGLGTELTLWPAWVVSKSSHLHFISFSLSLSWKTSVSQSDLDTYYWVLFSPGTSNNDPIKLERALTENIRNTNFESASNAPFHPSLRIMSILIMEGHL